jgi:hypothetical protein
LSGTSPIFTTVVPTQYIVSAPTTATAGTPILITAQLADIGGTPVKHAGRTVAWTHAVGLGGSFATPTSLTDGNGFAVVAWTPTVSGVHRIRATDQIGLTGITGNITVAGGAPASLFIRTQPSGTATAGVQFAIQPVVEIRDSFGNVVTSDNSTQVTAARVAGTGALGGTITHTAVNGVVTFTNLQYTVAETITIGFSSVPAVTGATSNNVVVGGASAASFVVSGSASQTAGTTQLVTITALDAFGNNANYNGAQSITVSGAGPSPGGIPPTATDNSAAAMNFGTPTTMTFFNGVATTTIALYNVETASIAVSAAGPINTPAPLSVTVSVGALSQFSVTAAGGGNVPDLPNPGGLVSLDITALDAFGNVQTSFNGAVNLTWVPNTAQIDFTPATSGAFTNGQLLGFNMQIDDTSLLGLAVQNIRIRVQNTLGGQSGLSNIFTVN